MVGYNNEIIIILVMLFHAFCKLKKYAEFMINILETQSSALGFPRS